MKTTIIIVISLMTALALKSQTYNYLVDFRQSDILWTAKKVGGEHTGSIKIKSGKFTVENGLITKGDFVVDMSSITNSDIKDESTNNSLLKHLKSPDFFDVEKFPEAKLEITGSEKSDGEFYEAKAQLTIKDVSMPYNFRYAYKNDEGKFVAMSSMTINRANFNVKYGSESFFKNLGDKVIYDNFDLKVSLIGKPL